MEPVKIGIIGLGNMGTNHIRSILSGTAQNLTVTAVCDVDKERTDAAKKLCPDAEVFTDYKELLMSDAVEAVLIATPHYFHPEMAVAAFDAGVHVMCEKPAGVYTKAVEKMNDAAKKSGVKFALMFNNRAANAFQELKRIIDSGELGEIKRIHWTVTKWYRPQAYHNSSSWRSTWRGEGGGVLINQCPHNIDLWQWLFGMPKSVSAKIHYGRYFDIEVEDDVTAYFEYENGVNGTFISATGEAPGINRLEIVSDMGTLTVTDGTDISFIKNVISEREFNKTCKAFFSGIKTWQCKLPVPPDGNLHAKLLTNFANAIRTGEELLVPGEEGINQLTLANAMHLSSWTGKDIELPIDADLYYEMLMERVNNSKDKKTVEKQVIADMSGSF